MVGLVRLATPGPDSAHCLCVDVGTTGCTCVCTVKRGFNPLPLPYILPSKPWFPFPARTDRSRKQRVWPSKILPEKSGFRQRGVPRKYVKTISPILIYNLPCLYTTKLERPTIPHYIKSYKWYVFLNCAADYLEYFNYLFKVHVLYQSFWVGTAIYVEIYV